MTFSTAVPLEARVEIEILGPLLALRSTSVVETVEGGIAEDVQPTLDSDGRSWVDPASELGEILPEHLLAICGNDRGHHFAQAFRVGTGTARAAQLILEVEADSGMSRNESSDLQHLSARGDRRTSLEGGRWWDRMGPRVVVDRSRLLSCDSGTVELHPHLASGRLDVVIQDNTAVHEAHRRISRGQ